MVISHIMYVTFSLKLPQIESQIKSSGGTILTPLVSLDTPGKATVQVIIVADPVSMGLRYEIKNLLSSTLSPKRQSHHLLARLFRK